MCLELKEYGLVTGLLCTTTAVCELHDIYTLHPSDRIRNCRNRTEQSKDYDNSLTPDIFLPFWENVVLK